MGNTRNSRERLKEKDAHSNGWRFVFRLPMLLVLVALVFMVRLVNGKSYGKRVSAPKVNPFEAGQALADNPDIDCGLCNASHCSGGSCGCDCVLSASSACSTSG